MFERLNSRHGLICLAFLFWTLATFHRFLNTAPQTPQNQPNIVPVKKVPEVLKVPDVLKVPEIPNLLQVPQLPAAFKLLERVDSLLNEEEAGFNSWWEEQLERRARVAQTCARDYLGEESESIHFLYDRNHKLLFCRNAKVGTTTWLEHFLALADLPEKKEKTVRPFLHERVPPLFELKPEDPPIPLLAQITLSFSMVRHPFERLVSAYENKVVKATGLYAKIRKELKEQFGELSFTSFVKMIIAQGKDVQRSRKKRLYLKWTLETVCKQVCLLYDELHIDRQVRNLQRRSMVHWKAGQCYICGKGAE